MAALFYMVLLPELLPWCRALRYIVSCACLKRCACANKSGRIAGRQHTMLARMCFHYWRLSWLHCCLSAFWVVLPQQLL